MFDAQFTVRIVDGYGNDRHVRFSGLSWAESAFGGWLWLNVSVTTELGAFTNLGPGDRIYVYDNGSGEIQFEGYLDTPARTVGPLGEMYVITATGPAGLGSDAARPHVLIDTALDGLERSQYSTKNATTSTDEVDSETPALEMSAAEGKTVAIGWTGDFIYRRIYDAGQKLAKVKASTISGVATPNYKQQIVTRQNPSGGASPCVSVDASVSSGTVSAAVGITDFSNGHNIASLRATRISSSTTGAETHWFQFYDVVMMAMLKDVDGTDVTTGYSGLSFTPDQVVRDLIGRGILPGIDPNRVTIDTSAEAIYQWAFHEGITGSGELDALAVIDPDKRWAWGPSTAAGHSFEYVDWDDEPWYLLSDVDGAIQPGGDNELCNRIVVTYTDRKSRQQTTIRGNYVPELGNDAPVLSDGSPNPSFVGRVRDADPVTLPEEFGTLANAQSVGDAILLRKATVPKSGTLNVRRMVRNLALGRDEYPWQIKSGRTARILETGDLLRITEITKDADERSASVTLGVPSLSPDELFDDLHRRGRILTAKQVTPNTLKAVHHLKGTKKKD